MNKTQLAIQAVLDQHDHTEALAEALLELAGSQPKSKANPDMEIDGVLNKWCTRHEMYHPLTDFTQKKSGAYDHNCDVAVGQWRAITKEIKTADKATLGLIGTDKLEDHVKMIEDLKAQRLAKYPFDNIVPAAEEAPIKPKRGGKK